MKTIMKALAFAVAPASLLAVSVTPAFAQSKQGIAVANPEQAMAQSVAYTTAMTQMKTTYKANIDSLNTRKTALEAELKQKSDALQAAVKAAGGKSTPALQTQYEALQKRGAEAQQELQRLNQPLALANAYVEQQIGAKLNAAIKAAMTKKNVDLVISPDAAVSYAPGVDITSAITAELNTLVPNVGIVPPAGWQPGQSQAAGQASGGR